MKNVSIIIPVYNREKNIIRALDSIPIRDDIEVIVVDDCSTDNTYDMMLSYKRLDILVYRNEENMGVGYTKQRGYDNASGRYIITIDSDDFVYTDKFNDAINKIIKCDDDIIFIDNDINDGTIWRQETRCATWSYFIKSEFIKKNNLKIDETLRVAEDWYLMEDIKKIKNVKYKHIDLVTYHYNYPQKEGLSYNRKKGNIK